MKEIPGYEGIYSITKDGRIWRHLVEGIDKRKRPRKHGGHFKKTAIQRHGYETIQLNVNSKPKLLYIHRLIAQAFIPNPDNLPCINHKNSIRSDNRLTNLEWCTYSQNVLHAYRTGSRKPSDNRGAKNPKAKLTNEQVTRMRQLRKEGLTLHQLGTHFGINFRTVWGIVTNNAWKHIPTPAATEH